MAEPGRPKMTRKRAIQYQQHEVQKTLTSLHRANQTLEKSKMTSQSPRLTNRLTTTTHDSNTNMEGRRTAARRDGDSEERRHEEKVRTRRTRDSENETRQKETRCVCVSVCVCPCVCARGGEVLMCAVVCPAASTDRVSTSNRRDVCADSLYIWVRGYSEIAAVHAASNDNTLKTVLELTGTHPISRSQSSRSTTIVLTFNFIITGWGNHFWRVVKPTTTRACHPPAPGWPDENGPRLQRFRRRKVARWQICQDHPQPFEKHFSPIPFRVSPHFWTFREVLFRTHATCFRLFPSTLRFFATQQSFHGIFRISCVYQAAFLGRCSLLSSLIVDAKLLFFLNVARSLARLSNSSS